MTNPFRPRRSCLFMPASNPRALEKAKALPADMVIFDLEDAVAPDAKEQARAAACAAVAAGGYGAREVLVRINALDTPWGEADIAALATSGADGILVPKIGTGDDIARLDQALAAARAPLSMGLWVMIETPLAVLNIAAIAAHAAGTRLAGFVIGTNDMAKDMLARPTPDRAAFQTALSLCVMAARAHGLAAIDGVYNDFSDPAGLEAECVQGRVLGFEGKSLIHPAQVEIANRVFAPGADELEQARAIVAAFADPSSDGLGAINVNGKMVERLHLAQAERLLAFEAAISG
ncbi:MAG: CoA ester lyase [Sphingomonadales bacterium]|nr:CoA ester lyase [Sphingomonadales bacterium]MBD3771989.1 CoA ester lyase [Paracoccaceae bacterium]